ncbi:MAG: type IX secretion system sortase PorU [Cytophagales bacterium]|nr:type IX secretion system sortase PorU [Cytophagales bacterium]
MSRIIKCISIIVLILGIQNVQAQATNSVLSSGDWYKISVSRTGVYKIDKDFLSNLGISTGSINPKNIQIYGNGGGMLPQPLSEARYDDLQENAIVVVGEDDGRFDDGDYILFYGESPNEIIADEDDSNFSHAKNVYSDNTYYFITIGESEGKRVPSITTSVESTTQTITSFDEYVYHEEDEYSIIISGREWYGEKFDNFTKTRTISLSTPNSIGEGDISVVTVAKATKASATFLLRINNSSPDTLSIGTSSSGYGQKARQSTRSYTELLNSSTNIRLDYENNGDNDSQGYLNRIGINYKRSLALSSGQLNFTSFESLSAENSTYELSGANGGTTIWDVTTPIDIKKQNSSLSGSTLSFNESSSTLRKYIAFTTSNTFTPTSVGKVENQNLHGMTDIPTLVIIAHPSFTEQAEDFATFKNESGIATKVVYLPQVYNEFSSGAQDVTAIRDFAKLLHDKSSNFKYLLLFGDASYDYKNRVDNNTNYVPTYEAYQSLNDITTYASDDYYGFLEETEGEWRETSSGNHTLDIGVGRFPVHTADQAWAMVNKVKGYHQRALFGNWRNEITFVSDDGDGNLHIRDANELSLFIKETYPEYNINKIYLDAFVQTSSAQGETSTSTIDAINSQIDRGTFIMNYTGHGGEVGWTQEQILSVPQINSWENEFLPLFVTATCEFGRYDDPKRISGAEYTILNPKGGGIAIIGTTRPVYASSNKRLNTAFYTAIFTPNEDGTMPALGDVMIKTKNNSLNSVYNRNFSLLGDPSLVLAYPQKNLVITSVNDGTSLAGDTIRALETVTMAGEVQDYQGQLLSDFNGKVFVKVYDKESDITTFANESDDSPYTFGLQNSVLYQGQASVEGGEFEFSFVVPKDISYQLGAGKVSLYAMSDEDLQDANGYKVDLVVGEGKEGVALDDDAPNIELFMDDRSFVSEGKTGADTRLIADVFDDNGINITNTGIGHEMTLVVDDDFNRRYVLNDYYTANLNEYQSGVIDYPLYGLSEGRHTLSLKVWDTHNNSSTETISFYVGDELSLSNYPNPVEDHTNFIIDHGRAGETVEIELVLYSTTGQTISTIETTIEESPSTIYEVMWDGTDDSGERVAEGIYLYRLSIYYPSDNKTISAIEKLVVTN